MRKSLFLLAAIGPLAAVAALAVPALAQSGGGASVTQPASPLDLDKIPVKPVTGKQAVHGVAMEDEGDDASIVGSSAGHDHGLLIEADDHGPGHAGARELDD